MTRIAKKHIPDCFLFLFLASFASGSIHAQSGDLGIFDTQSDVGAVTPPGSASYNAATGSYTLSAAGANMWLGADAFHFLWKKASGDISFSADIQFPKSGGSPHRKAALLLRQSLDPDAIYADAALHGDGMTALQYRKEKSAFTQDIEFNIAAPKRLRIDKRGDSITLYISMTGEPMHPAGAAIKLPLDGSFYVGLGVCSHDVKVTETAVFSNVELKPLPPLDAAKTALYSTLQSIDIDPKFRRAIVAYSAPGYFEAPNWSRDGKYLIFDQGGHMMTVPVEGGVPRIIDTGNLTNCTGSHGLSLDGTQMVVSCTQPGNPGTRIFAVPASGGTPRQITANPASYWHAWSPDQKTLVFVRPHDNILTLMSIPFEGGQETPLTTYAGISDDPDFSPDGKYIYFNSNRGGGTMQIWRMKPDGSEPVQITNDERNNWTPHPSPDGKWIVYLSYDKSVTTHAVNKDIQLRLISLPDGKISTLLNIFGGSGSMNVPSWSPDSHHLAFVSYELLPAEVQ